MRELICCRWCKGAPKPDYFNTLKFRECTNPKIFGLRGGGCAYCPDNNRPEMLEIWERRFGSGLFDPRKCCSAAEPSGVNAFPRGG